MELTDGNGQSAKTIKRFLEGARFRPDTLFLTYAVLELMANTTVLAASCLVVVGLVAPVAAHHSFAGVYDQTKPLKIEGTVVRVEWQNPHVVLHVKSTDDEGASIEWSFEMGAPRVLTERLGWSADRVKLGDRITLEGFLARSGGRQAAAQFVTTASGVRLRSVLPFR